MNKAYQPFQRQADHIYRRLRDMIDDHHDRTAQELEKISMDVREMIENDRPPRAVEDRIRQVQHLLEPLEAHPGRAMTPQDAHALFEEYEELRRELRHLPNY